MSEEDEWVDANRDWDYGSGFTQIGEDLDNRFGTSFRFGYAGGCVNMVTRLESGEVVNITDCNQPWLTPLGKRTDEGFTISIQAEDVFARGGEPLVLINRPGMLAEDLGDLVEEALSELNGKRQ